MVVLCAPSLCPICIRRTVEHEGIHRSCDPVAGSLLDFPQSFLCWSMDPGVHVLERHIGILGQY